MSFIQAVQCDRCQKQIEGRNIEIPWKDSYLHFCPSCIEKEIVRRVAAATQVSDKASVICSMTGFDPSLGLKPSDSDPEAVPQEDLPAVGSRWVGKEFSQHTAKIVRFEASPTRRGGWVVDYENEDGKVVGMLFLTFLRDFTPLEADTEQRRSKQSKILMAALERRDDIFVSVECGPLSVKFQRNNAELTWKCGKIVAKTTATIVFPDSVDPAVEKNSVNIDLMHPWGSDRFHP